jgi:hypothetical protein
MHHEFSLLRPTRALKMHHAVGPHCPTCVVNIYNYQAKSLVNKTFMSTYFK